MVTGVVVDRDQAQLERLLERQSGVICRRQVVGAGFDDNDIERRLRRREWAVVHRSVYLSHTGEPSWKQRAWAAVLVHPRAALDASSALRAFGAHRSESDAGTIEVVVPAGRRVRDPEGVRSRQLARFDTSCQLHLGPPRLRLEPAALRVAARANSTDAAIAVLGDVVQAGRTTPHRLRAAVLEAPRLRHRALLLDVLGDLDDGALSALESRYLRDVELAHRLPRAQRQVRAVTRSGVAFRDVTYAEQALVVELDGRLGHSTTADRWADLERDLQAAVDGYLTLRAGWRQVLDPCRLAGVVGDTLRSRGWAGEVALCPSCPTGADGHSDTGDLPAPGAGRSPVTLAAHPSATPTCASDEPRPANPLSS